MDNFGFRGWSLQVGSPFGIPLILHWTFLLIFGLPIFLGLSAGDIAGTAGFASLIVMIFGSVTAHEIGHSLVAKRLGYETSRITLLPIGGLATIPCLSTMKPRDELLVAVGGPLVNVIILAIIVPLGFFTTVPAMLVFVNVAMLVFNLIPAFPLDGGRMFRALLAIYRGNIYSATDTAVNLGRILSVIMVAAALATTHIWLLIIAVFIFLGGTAEKQALNQRRMMHVMGDDWRRGPV